MPAQTPRVEGEYKQFVDYEVLQVFKDMMVEVSKRTAHFSFDRRNVLITYGHRINRWNYVGGQPHSFSGPVLEGLGNKDWIARWMQLYGDNKSYMDQIAQDLALMSVTDGLPALPFLYHDEVTTRASEWFKDTTACGDFAQGTFDICELCGMTLGGGESPTYRFLLQAFGDVDDAPVMSAATNGIIVNPDLNFITSDRLKAGLSIIAVRASGMHSNGASMVIDRGLGLPDKFMTVLPNGNTYGAEALIPTMSYVGLIEAIQHEEVELACILPGTGDGIAKLAADKRDFTYRVHTWWTEEQIPMIMRFLLDQGVTPLDMVTTFNMGTGLYLFAHPQLVDLIIKIGIAAGYELMVVGRVEEGPRQTVIDHGIPNVQEIILPPPGK